MSMLTSIDDDAAFKRSPDTVLAVAAPRSMQLPLHIGVGTALRVVNARDYVVAARHLQNNRVACLMLFVPAVEELHLISKYERLLHWHPDVPVIAIYDCTVSSCDALLAFGKIGVREVVGRHELGDAAIVTAFIARCQPRAVAADLEDSNEREFVRGGRRANRK